jgi:cob(I)alamin adenosyltransferase
MKIYTRTGDDGTTGLFGGQRTRKSDPRIDCYGTIDELSASLGLAASVAPPNIARQIHTIQNELFTIGSHLATPEATPASRHLPALEDSSIARLEMEIDAAESELLPLKQFILPGGCELACRLHLARTICRRAERVIVDFSMDRPVPSLIVMYLNRLSDHLFTHARLANHRQGVADVPWIK